MKKVKEGYLISKDLYLSIVEVDGKYLIPLTYRKLSAEDIHQLNQLILGRKKKADIADKLGCTKYELSKFLKIHYKEEKGDIREIYKSLGGVYKYAQRHKPKYNVKKEDKYTLSPETLRQFGNYEKHMEKTHEAGYIADQEQVETEMSKMYTDRLYKLSGNFPDKLSGK